MFRTIILKILTKYQPAIHEGNYPAESNEEPHCRGGGIDKLINRLAYGQQRHGSRTFAGTNISYVS
jgi:hypothetical protein